MFTLHIYVCTIFFLPDHVLICTRNDGNLFMVLYWHHLKGPRVRFVVNPRPPGVASVGVGIWMPLRNQYYIALRSRSGGPAFWTTSYGEFCNRTCIVGSHDFDPASVCHAFASHAECSAYLAGAQQGWPQEAR